MKVPKFYVRRYMMSEDGQLENARALIWYETTDIQLGIKRTDLLNANATDNVNYKLEVDWDENSKRNNYA
jgi:hypothetical protein